MLAPFIMLARPTFLIFLSLSVAAIHLGPNPNGQTPHIRGRFIPRGLAGGLPIPNLPIPNGLPASLPLLQSIPSFTRPKFLRRFIMGADYASSSGPFLGKSSHKRQDPLSDALRSLPLSAPTTSKEESPPNSVS